MGPRGLDWDVRGFEVCSYVGLSLFDLLRFFLVKFLVELDCGEGFGERFVFPVDFAFTDELRLAPLLLDRLLFAKPLRGLSNSAIPKLSGFSGGWSVARYRLDSVMVALWNVR